MVRSLWNTEIVSDPEVRQGEPVLAGTTTSVRAIAELWNQGMAPEEIPLHLPHLPHFGKSFAALYYYLAIARKSMPTLRQIASWSSGRASALTQQPARLQLGGVSGLRL